MKELRDKRVLITGASRGIGLALAERFASVGAQLLLTDIDEESLEAAQRVLAEQGANAAAYRLDVTDPVSIAAAREAVLAAGGSIDLLVNNAGVIAGGAFLEVPLEDHERTYRINTLGLVAVTYAFLPDLNGRPDAHIVNIASASGFVALPYGTTYASSKWAVIGFSDSLRLELRETGNAHVHVTTVCPGYVATRMFAGATSPLLTPLLQPHQLADRTVAAVRRNRPFVKTPWTVHLGPLIRGVLPTRAADAVTRVFGVHTSMRDWTGRD